MTIREMAKNLKLAEKAYYDGNAEMTYEELGDMRSAYTLALTVADAEKMAKARDDAWFALRTEQVRKAWGAA